MRIVAADGKVTQVTNLPDSMGMLDVVLAPDFATSRIVVFSYIVRDRSASRIGRGRDDPSQFPERLTVARARLVEADGGAALEDVKEIFRQEPAIVALSGSGEFGGRIVYTNDNLFLIISSGDRQELDANYLFSTTNNIGKMIRLRADGSVPGDNPYAAIAGSRPEIWTIGHRNAYGLVFTPDTRLWSSEMGPKGGDELNIILPGKNYGWPAVSQGDNYDGSPIPRHMPGDGYMAPQFSWTPVIAPAGMIYYDGDEFADWRGSLLLTGLQSNGIVRVRTNGDAAQEVQRISLGARIRDIAKGAGGSLYIITDGATGALRRITPVFRTRFGRASRISSLVPAARSGDHAEGVERRLDCAALLSREPRHPVEIRTEGETGRVAPVVDLRAIALS
jgi:glucose/arabinose dehydrogenase